MNYSQGQRPIRSSSVAPQPAGTRHLRCPQDLRAGEVPRAELVIVGRRQHRVAHDANRRYPRSVAAEDGGLRGVDLPDSNVPVVGPGDNEAVGSDVNGGDGVTVAAQRPLATPGDEAEHTHNPIVAPRRQLRLTHVDAGNGPKVATQLPQLASTLDIPNTDRLVVPTARRDVVATDDARDGVRVAHQNVAIAACGFPHTHIPVSGARDDRSVWRDGDGENGSTMPFENRDALENGQTPNTDRAVGAGGGNKIPAHGHSGDGVAVTPQLTQ
mmetsp:Transcript_15099/g.35833  ORF Transcript_15099/g.35833 Transcript_15099/m.35833 type:complete len:270 (+) Transcript_15099:1017-1826(+)